MHDSDASRNPEPPGRTGVLVLRVWVEQEAPGQLRARLTMVDDVTEPGDTTMVTAAGLRAICDAVEGWLVELSRADQPPG